MGFWLGHGPTDVIWTYRSQNGVPGRNPGLIVRRAPEARSCPKSQHVLPGLIVRRAGDSGLLHLRLKISCVSLMTQSHLSLLVLLANADVPRVR